MLLSLKCDTSGCQGYWHHYLLQRSFNGRSHWSVTSEYQPSPLASRLSKGWKMSAGRSFKAGKQWLLHWPLGLPHTFNPCVMPPITRHSAPSPTQCQTDADRQLFLKLFFFNRKGGCGQWGHVRNTCLVTAVRGTRRSPCKEIGRSKLSVNRGAKEMECENWGQRKISHEASRAPRTGGRESQKLESVHKKAAFLFCSTKCGKYKILEEGFSP